MTEDKKTISIKAEERDVVQTAVNTLRKDGKMPAVLYGSDVKNQNLTLNYREFEKVYSTAGSSSLVDITVAGKKPVKVIIQDIQRNPKTDEFIHADFYQVKMTEKITADANLVFVGESKAVKEMGGVMIRGFDTLKIECLPQDLVHEIEVDISSLKTYDDIIRVNDVKLPDGVTAREIDDKVVASVKPPRTEAELKELEEAPVEEGGEEVPPTEKEGEDDKDKEEGAEEGVKTKEDDEKKK